MWFSLIAGLRWAHGAHSMVGALGGIAFGAGALVRVALGGDRVWCGFLEVGALGVVRVGGVLDGVEGVRLWVGLVLRVWTTPLRGRGFVGGGR